MLWAEGSLVQHKNIKNKKQEHQAVAFSRRSLACPCCAGERHMLGFPFFGFRNTSQRLTITHRVPLRRSPHVFHPPCPCAAGYVRRYCGRSTEQGLLHVPVYCEGGKIKDKPEAADWGATRFPWARVCAACRAVLNASDRYSTYLR